MAIFKTPPSSSELLTRPLGGNGSGPASGGRPYQKGLLFPHLISHLGDGEPQGSDCGTRRAPGSVSSA